MTARATTRRSIASITILTTAIAFLAFLGTPGGLLAQPAGYYDTVDATSQAALRQTLHEVIDDHTWYPYTDSATDTWDIVNLADEDPNDTGRIIDIYKNASYAKIPGGVGAYNREHSWPKSYGFPNLVDFNYPYTDVHHLFACDGSYNSSRSNKPFRLCNAGCSEKTTDFNDGRGGGSGVYPGNSNWTTGSFTQGTWETWDGRKGDVARAMFYMDLRYEGGFHGITGHFEPDLILTDDEGLIDGGNTGANETTAYMGMLSVLLSWHQQDPVDAREIWRNEVVYTFQGNRNPFIDNPQWANCLFTGVCSSDTDPPAAPASLMASALDGGVDLTWLANSESDLAGYNLFRATASGGPYTQVNGALITDNFYTDTGLANGVTYYYVVTAVDTSFNESMASNEASATPDGPAPAPGGLVLSEVLYDVSSSDDGWEWVELYNGTGAAIDLSSHCLGNGGTSYTTSLAQLTGSIASGAVFVVGGPSSGGTNANPAFDQALDFSPDFQNSGSTGDGVALFDVPCAQVSGATVPIDAVVYGPNNNNSLIDETGSANAPEVGDAPAGSSIERVDTAGAWQIQGSPNPNVTALPPPVGNAAPTVTVTAPADGTTVSQGTNIAFAGSAGDPEDGDLSASISWTSDLDGAIGSGASFSTSTLSVGSHTITAQVTDSGGLSGSDQISVTVQAVAPSPGTLILSEVFYDASGTDDGLEWVEIYNADSVAIDLSGFSLGNGGTDYTTSLVQLSGTIAPGAIFVVGGPTSSAANGNPAFDQAVNFTPDFQNSGTAGDGVALFNLPVTAVTAATVPIDAVVYGPDNANGLIDETGNANAPEVGDAPAGSSIERLDLAGDWGIQPSPSPGSSPLTGPPPNTAPTVTITAPGDGASFTEGASVTFAGSASDAEDGDISASLSWTSDLDGAIGSGASFNTSTLSVGSHTITAQVTDAGGLSGSDQITVIVTAASGPVEVTFTAVASEDGWVRESSENSNAGGKNSSTGTGASGLRVGDDKKDKQYKTVVSFDTSAIPDGATIVSAKLRLRRGKLTGSDPFSSHGACWVDVHSGGLGGSTALANGDFEAAATVAKTATLSAAASNGDWSEGDLDPVGLGAVDRTGTTQLRVYFDLDDDDDRGNDYMGYYAADNSNVANHPQLVITYQE